MAKYTLPPSRFSRNGIGEMVFYVLLPYRRQDGVEPSLGSHRPITMKLPPALASLAPESTAQSAAPATAGR